MVAALARDRGSLIAGCVLVVVALSAWAAVVLQVVMPSAVPGGATKVHHWSAAFCVRAIADLYARCPRLRVVFCTNCKIAEAWTRNYFAGLSALASGSSTQDRSVIENGDPQVAVPVADPT
jgi:hypothetical protein